MDSQPAHESAPGDPAPLDAVDVALPEDLTAPGRARDTARAALERWRLPALLDAVVLAVSELVTNAVRHGRPPVRLTLRLRPDAVDVHVRDHGAGPAEPTALPDADAESGRGGAIVASLADDSSIEQVPGDGTVVRARFGTTPRAH